MNKRLVAIDRQIDSPYEIGVVHIAGLDAHEGKETLCLRDWTAARYEPTTDPATCLQCVDAAREALQILQRAKRSGLFR